MSPHRLLLTAVLCAVPSIVQSDDQNEANKRLKFMTSAAGAFTLTSDDSTEAFPLMPKPLARWNNAISGASDGGLFLWTDEGRPAAAVKFYQKTDGTWLHNLQSLSREPFSARLGGQTVWNPRSAGVTFQPLPDAPTPASTTAQRKRQLRRLAGQFQLVEQYQEQDSWQLRQLTTPLLQYEAAEEGVLDGALFAFVVGTTPEAVLLIEAHHQPAKKTDQPVWMYAFAPLTGYAISAQHNGVDVWSVERRKLRRPITEAYTSDYFSPQ